MRRPARIILGISACAAALILILSVSAILVLRSEWFRAQVHARMIQEVEKATGGRVESGPLSFDWRHLRARVQDFVLRGTEPAAADPLFRASSIGIGLKVLSVLRTRVELATLDVQRPRVHLIIGPDGSTNVPRPKLRTSRKNALETILDLAVNHFDLSGGVFAVDGQTAKPFSAKGENLRAVFLYHTGPARYQGNLSVAPLDLQWGDRAIIPAAVNLAVALERNRIQVSSASLTSGKSRIEIAGALDNVVAAQGAFHYQAQADLQELGRLLRTPVLQQGTAQVKGDLRLAGLANLAASGTLAVTRMGLLINEVRLEDAHAVAAFTADTHRIVWKDLRVSGSALTRLNQTNSRFPVHTVIRDTVLQAGGIEATGVTVETLGGRFAGLAAFPKLRRFQVEGQIQGFDIRRLVALLTPREIPWDGQADGPLRVEGSLFDRRDVSVDARVAVSPAASGPAVSGSVALHYDVRRGLLDLGNSSVSLPRSQVRFSGVLGAGPLADPPGSVRPRARDRQAANLQVHLTSEDLTDLLPALDLISDNPPKSLPLQLHNGKAIFEGSVAGPLAGPAIEGRVSLTNFVIYGRSIDSFQGGISLSPAAAELRDGVVAHGPARARLSGSIALEQWKPRDSSTVSGRLDMQQASIPNLLALGGQANLPIDGALSVTGQLSGTYGHPRGEGELAAVHGQIYGEPFDRLTGKLLYTGDTAQLNSAQLIAGRKQLAISAAYRHNPGDLAAGRLRFEVSSNAMGLDQFQVIAKEFPGIAGVLQVKASGEIETAPAGPGHPGFRINNLNGEASAAGLRLDQREFGNLRATATSKGDTVFGVLDSDFAGAAIHGAGQFRLADDNPGTARITFERVGLGRVERTLGLLPANFHIGGSTEGTLTVEGPAMNPDLWKATLQVPHFRLAPAAQSELGARRQDFAVTNSGPIQISMSRRVVRVESARFVGRTTDISLSGGLSLAQRNPLDLRLNGRVDLALLQDFVPDLTSSGTVLTDASIRGPFRRPLVNGRLEVKGASLNLANFPNGLSNGNGVIRFSGNGATIENLTGETGGGKVTITGFAGYEANQAVFRLLAKASQVRVRYPEGVSTVADATLNWTGTTDGNMLSGSVTILHSGFNPRTDLGSILTQSAQPVRTPAARTGLLGSTRFDVQIATSPILTVQSSLTQDVVMEGSLRLRGTFSNPALLGRINIVQGQLVFFGTKYTIDQGSISFYNPVRVEPVVNMDLQTKARGVEVILNIAGPLNKLALTPRSDPPLPFNEIVSLLATGRTPTSVDVPLATSSQVTGSQGWQQMGASALLAEAVSNPVAGRLQRFFGITKLRIDPSLTGIEFNPQARITLEQQITPNITFTYITNVTNSNPLVVQVEWALNPRWSVIAVRDENGLFGIDFFYKKRFR